MDPSLPSTPRAIRAADRALHDRVFAAWADVLVRKGVEWDAPQAVVVAEALGLEADGEGLVQLLRGGGAPARLWSRTLAATAGAASDPADVSRLVEILDEPGYVATQPLGLAMWAQRGR